MLSGFKCLMGRRPRHLLLKIDFPILLILALFIFRLHETEAARGRRRLCRASRGQAGAAW